MTWEDLKKSDMGPTENPLSLVKCLVEELSFN